MEHFTAASSVKKASRFWAQGLTFLGFITEGFRIQVQLRRKAWNLAGVMTFPVFLLQVVRGYVGAAGLGGVVTR